MAKIRESKTETETETEKSVVAFDFGLLLYEKQERTDEKDHN